MSDTFGVEQVVELEGETCLVRAVPDLTVPHGGTRRLRARIFDQRARSEVPNSEAAEQLLAGSTARPPEMTRSSAPGIYVAGGTAVGKLGLRKCDVSLAREPGATPPVIRPLEPDSTARPAGFRRAGVADEHQFGIDPEVPQRRVDCRPRMRTVRMPNSAPLARTSGVTRSDGLTGQRIDADPGAARIVAVETHPALA